MTELKAGRLSQGAPGFYNKQKARKKLYGKTINGIGSQCNY